MLLLLFLLVLSEGEGHISLTFPQARFPPLDFLDTARTSGPCGMPKPQNARYTTLFVNERYNFTWRMQYPHQGGYRLTLLDGQGQLLEQLAPTESDGYLGDDDQTAQHAEIKFTRTCHQCVVLLERQALEWGKAYKFRSCADVNVLDRTQNNFEKCNGHGDFEQGRCKCRHSYSGDRCQYKDYCSTDEDCLNDGKCVKEVNALVPRTCFCAFGYFGPNCDRSCEVKASDDECFNYDYPKNEEQFEKNGLFKEKCYRRNELSKDDFVYSRIINDELEIILDYASNTWIAIGWRPMEIDRSCRLFPDLENARRKRNATINILSTTPLEHGDNVPEINPNLLPAPIPKLPKNNGLLKSTLLAPLHPMDCTDIVIGTVRDGRSRINDMYTRDRSTPLTDTWFDGEESFSAAYGIERDGRTIIVFRRRVAEIEPTDHPLGPGEIFVIWAKGQTSQNYAHPIQSALEIGKAKNSDFYRRDQLKYHGIKNRGAHPIEFVSVNDRPPNIRPPPRIRQREGNQQTPSNIEVVPSPSTKQQTLIISSNEQNLVTEPRIKVDKQESKSNVRFSTTITDVVMNHGTDLGDTQEFEYFYFDNSSPSLGISLINVISAFILITVLR